MAYVGQGDHAARFFELFIVQTKEPLVGQPFRHLTWHAITTHSVYGWTHRESGYRRYRKAYIAIPKKNVKSAYCSCAALKSIRADGESKAYTYGAAVDRQQARIVFDEAADYVRKSEDLADDIHIIDSKARLVHLESGSFYAVLSADAHRAEGLDAHTVIMDEIHVQPNRKLFVKLKRAGRARRQPLFWIISEGVGALLQLDDNLRIDARFHRLAMELPGARWSMSKGYEHAVSNQAIKGPTCLIEFEGGQAMIMGVIKDDDQW